MKKMIVFLLITNLLTFLVLIIMCNSEFKLKSLSLLYRNKPVYNIDKRFSECAHIFHTNTDSLTVIRIKKGELIKNKIKNDSKFSINPTSNKPFQVKLKPNIEMEEFEFDSKKILTLSDVEGNFNVFVSFLKNNKVIDDDFNWIFGNGHLVCNGDFFDRGNDVTATLWLIYKLEEEAKAQGGKVHFIIGNHEEMNLRGNTKYVDEKYTDLADKLKIPYKELYGKDSEIGKWLRTKNSILKINNIIFVHGGISYNLMKNNYSLKEINELTQQFLGEKSEYIEFINPRAAYLFNREGPMWYRGYFGDYKDYYKAATQADIEAVLHYFEANRIVVGHTIVDQVMAMYNNKVIAIDVMSANDPRKKDDDEMAVSCEGLFIENGNFYRALFNGKKELMFTQND